MSARRGGWLSTVEGALLLLLGAAALAFALRDDYATLMNPTFRPLTVVGAVLVLGMGLARVAAPPRPGSRTTVAVFATFLLLVGIARPDLQGARLGMGGLPPDAFPPADAIPEGYEPIRLAELYLGLDADDGSVSYDQPYVVMGLVARPPSVSAEGDFMLVDPVMACCLADAIGYAMRVDATGDEPLDVGRWMHVYGRVERRPGAGDVPPFQLGAIRFITVDGLHVIRSEGVGTYESRLPTLWDRLAGGQASSLRSAVQSAGLQARLEAKGPYTLFAPVDAAFARGDATPDAASPEALRAWLLDHVVEGRWLRGELFDVDALTTLSGRRLPVQVDNGRVRVGGARILFADELARNGVVHRVFPFVEADDAPESR